MHTSTIHPAIDATAAEELQVQIAALRKSLRNHRDRARNMWNACVADGGEEAGEARLALGRFTEKFLMSQKDEVYS
jgi:hypothetical protein